MGKLQKVLLFILLFVIVAVIILTWGSIGSAILTLALLLGVGFILLRKFMDSHDPDDFRMDL
ncbi:MAG: hypothetical protein IJ375_06330 [Oscillospiraceae bacterium]|nr:hypothetical protein [Oscillospiraceae bacterium]